MLNQKDTKAFAYLYDNYAAALYGIIMRIVKDEGAAEEILQDAFLKIWDRFGEYNANKGRLFTWMLNLSRNLAIDALRSKTFTKQSKTDRLENSVHTEADETASKPEFIGVKDALDKLPEEQKLLIDLMYFQGYSQSEISEEFQIPLGTVKTRVRSAMQKLREFFS